MNPLPEYLSEQLTAELRSRRVVVWFDPSAEFPPFIESIGRGASSGVAQVTLGELSANLAVYRGSFFALRLLLEPIVSAARPEPTLVYVPGVEVNSTSSPLKELECAGALFQRSLSRVAKQLMRRIYTDGAIDELLGSKQLAYADILRLLETEREGGGSILKLVLGDLDSAALLAKWLDGTGYDKDIEAKGGRSELLKLIATRCGLSLEGATPLDSCRDQVCRFLLVNEFRVDLSGEHPASISRVPKANLKEQREFVCKVLDLMRRNSAKTYEMIADSVEAEFSLHSAKIAAANLGDIDTFRFEERVLLKHVGELIAGGAYDNARALIERHRGSFWATQDVTRRPAQWELCACLAELGAELVKASKALQTSSGTARDCVQAFTAEDGWHRVDSLHRRMEAQVLRMQEEPEAEQAVSVVRSRVDDFLRSLAAAFTSAFESEKWSVPSVLHQTRIYPQKVAALPGRVAWFHVDAMRYEMAEELRRLLSEAREAELVPAIAALPSITPLCMAALLPGASASYSVVDGGGKVAAKIGNVVLSDVGDRMVHLRNEVPDSGDITLEQVLRLTGPKLQEKISAARLLVVRSQEIDALGEKNEMLARQLMDTVIGNLARAMRKLAAVGYERFVITADHGHQFSTRRDDDMKLDAPKGAELELHRRCWIGRGPSVPVGAVRVSATDLGYDSNLEFVFPQGLGVFKAGGGLSYHHGGFSLQELVIPVLSFRMPVADAGHSSDDTSVDIQVDFQTITNRTFVVNVEAGQNLLDQEPVRIRMVLVSKGEEVGYAGMAPGATFENKVLSIKPGQRVSVVMLLTKDDVTSLTILAQAADSPAVFKETKSLPVKLKS